MGTKDALTTTEVLAHLRTFKPAVTLRADAIREYAERGLAPKPLKKSSGGRGIQKLWPPETAAELAASWQLIQDCQATRETVAEARKIALYLEASGHTIPYQVTSDKKLNKLILGKDFEVFFAVKWLSIKLDKLSRDSVYLKYIDPVLGILASGDDPHDAEWTPFIKCDDAFLPETKDPKSHETARRAWEHDRKRRQERHRKK